MSYNVHWLKRLDMIFSFFYRRNQRWCRGHQRAAKLSEQVTRSPQLHADLLAAALHQSVSAPGHTGPEGAPRPSQPRLLPYLTQTSLGKYNVSIHCVAAWNNCFPYNWRYRSNVWSMMGQRLRRWPSIDQTLGQFVFSAFKQYYSSLVRVKYLKLWPL